MIGGRVITRARPEPGSVNDACTARDHLVQLFLHSLPFLMPGEFKGMGEGGTIGAPAALANAVADAVRSLGVRVTDLPIRLQGVVYEYEIAPCEHP